MLPADGVTGIVDRASCSSHRRAENPDSGRSSGGQGIFHIMIPRYGQGDVGEEAVLQDDVD